MPNYNRKGPENEGPRTGRKLGRSNPENKGLSDEEIARKNADQPKQGQGRGDRRKFNQVSPKKGKRGPNRKHRPNGDENDTSGHGQGKGRGHGRGKR